MNTRLFYEFFEQSENNQNIFFHPNKLFPNHYHYFQMAGNNWENISSVFFTFRWSLTAFVFPCNQVLHKLEFAFLRIHWPVLISYLLLLLRSNIVTFSWAYPTASINGVKFCDQYFSHHFTFWIEVFKAYPFCLSKSSIFQFTQLSSEICSSNPDLVMIFLKVSVVISFTFCWSYWMIPPFQSQC